MNVKPHEANITYIGRHDRIRTGDLYHVKVASLDTVPTWGLSGEFFGKFANVQQAKFIRCFFNAFVNSFVILHLPGFNP